MLKLEDQIHNYLYYCEKSKKLSPKTLRAYETDLNLFLTYFCDFSNVNRSNLENFIIKLHNNYKPKTVKRKIASSKAFFRYLIYQGIIETNPFDQIQLSFRDTSSLPRIIPLITVEEILSTAYTRYSDLSLSSYQKRKTLRDITVLELLFATGMRVSELCSLRISSVNLQDNILLILGKGSKERKIQICNPNVIEIMHTYFTTFQTDIERSGYFFTNKRHQKLSTQSVRYIINFYCKQTGILSHITPHMFRHTFATALLDADVDIRYIQEMLGHSSIHVTEIYTHVSLSKQKQILSQKHPRNNFSC